MPCEISDLWNELSLLEDRLASKRLNILKIQLNLDEDESDMSQVEGEPVLELKKIESCQASIMMKKMSNMKIQCLKRLN